MSKQLTIRWFNRVAVILAAVLASVVFVSPVQADHLGTPTLVAPSGGVCFVTGASVKFDWSTVTGADLYRLEIAYQSDTSWSDPWLRKHPWPSDQTVTLSATGDFKWRVQARADNGAHVSGWSETRTFSVAADCTSTIYGAAMTPHTRDRWNQVTNLLGPLKMPRGFNSSLPSTYEQGEWNWHDDAGLTGLISVKPDVEDTVAGTNYAQIRDFAATVPDGTWITAWHEPENDAPLQNGVFVDMICNFARAAKDGNPTLQVGYAAMAYQWGTGQASTADPTDWTPAMNCVDWVGADVYSYNWSGPDDSLYEHQEFQRWYSYFGGFAGKIGIVERGISQYATGGTRADVLRKDIQFVREKGFDLYLYWNADADAGRPEVWKLDNDPQACQVIKDAATAAI